MALPGSDLRDTRLAWAVSPGEERVHQRAGQLLTLLTLNDAVEARQGLIGIRALSAGVVTEHDIGRRRTVPAFRHRARTDHGRLLHGKGLFSFDIWSAAAI